MFGFIERILKKIGIIESKNTSTNTSTTMPDSPKIKEQIMESRRKDLEEAIKSKVIEKYPNTKSFSVFSYVSKHSPTIVFSIDWIDGFRVCLVKSVVMAAIEEFISSEIPEITMDNVRVSCYRNYSEDALLKAAKPYANCLCKELPINSNNIKCLCVGGVTIFDLARGDLDLRKEV